MDKEKICGIYKITNMINQKSYIGQSIDIVKRWRKHQNCAFNSNTNALNYNYPLYCAFRKYGMNNFEFKVLEVCPNDRNILNQKEVYWIEQLKPLYNQTKGGDCLSSKCKYYKLTDIQIKEIQNILVNDTKCIVSHKLLAQKYNVSQDTIQAINVGRQWHNDSFTYPLHYSKFDYRKPENYYIKEKNKCQICGQEISSKSTICVSCSIKNKTKALYTYKEIKTNEELQKTLQAKLVKTSVNEVANAYGVNPKTIREWCNKLNIPYKKQHSICDIKEKVNNKCSVNMFNKIGELVKCFESTREASRYLIQNNHLFMNNESGISAHIVEVCKGKRKSAYGYIWQYAS